MIYFQTDYAIVSWDAAVECVIIEWHGYTGGGQDKVQTGHIKVLELASQKQARKWISDLRDLRVVDKADQEWISQELTPLLAKAGIKFTAIVLPESALGKLSFNSVAKQLKEGEITRATFGSVAEAKAWLLTK